MSIPQNVKQLRKEKGISADLIARHVGKTSRQWVYDLEKGNIKRFLDEDLKKLAEILGVTIDDLRKGEGNSFSDKFEFYLPKIEHDLKKLAGFKEKYYYLLEENRRLWRENAYLKSLLITNDIDIYNADIQNETP